jgi:hypothetical protein
MRWLSFSVVVSLALSPSGSLALAKDDENWVGKRVILKPETMINTELPGKEKKADGLAIPRAVEPRSLAVYRVRRQDGLWLDLLPEHGFERGWVQQDNVVPIEKAAEFATRLVENEPRSAAAYHYRGLVWGVLGDLDNAIAPRRCQGRRCGG